MLRVCVSDVNYIELRQLSCNRRLVFAIRLQKLECQNLNLTLIWRGGSEDKL